MFVCPLRNGTRWRVSSPGYEIRRGGLAAGVYGRSGTPFRQQQGMSHLSHAFPQYFLRPHIIMLNFFRSFLYLLLFFFFFFVIFNSNHIIFKFFSFSHSLCPLWLHFLSLFSSDLSVQSKDIRVWHVLWIAAYF